MEEEQSAWAGAGGCTTARSGANMDTIDFVRVFAFTAVDIFSREADVFLAPELTGVNQ